MPAIVPTEVTVEDPNSRLSVVELGEAVSAGGPVYAADDKYDLAAATTEDESQVEGILLYDVSGDGRYGVIVTSGLISFGDVLTQGVMYALSAAGGIIPVDELDPDDWLTIIGWAESESLMRLDIKITGVQVNPTPPTTTA